ncbi:hypothetical protein AGMMS50276_00120 [Synergistales bacterium]|nr:hypothetical protein AGMMS50276_00120 [Synergistales bacterium]
MTEHTLETFILGNLDARNQRELTDITGKHRIEKDAGKNFFEQIDKFVRQLSGHERKNIFEGIVSTIAIPALKMSNHFFARMVERYADLDFRILCMRIQNCVKSALKHKRERVKKDGMVIVIAPDERMLITLYTRLI